MQQCLFSNWLTVYSFHPLPTVRGEVSELPVEGSVLIYNMNAACTAQPAQHLNCWVCKTSSSSAVYCSTYHEIVAGIHCFVNSTGQQSLSHFRIMRPGFRPLSVISCHCGDWAQMNRLPMTNINLPYQCTSDKPQWLYKGSSWLSIDT